MSKAFDALKLAALIAKHKDSQTAATDIADNFERRKSGRVHVRIPLFVYGCTPEGAVFCAEAYTIEISAHGALVCIETPVQTGQRLLVVNNTNELTQECRVLSVDARLGRDLEVAFEFLRPMPQFWRELRRESGVRDGSRELP